MDMVAPLIIAVIVFLCLSFSKGHDVGVVDTQDKAAQTECARYHPDTGKFEWIGEE